ncbi:MAG: hypothetical protein ACI89L_001386 [Phycisphaerales bacterium]|jgi:hypothetical protein
MRMETRVRIVAGLVLLGSLLGSGVLSPRLAASVGRHGLAYTDRGEEGDPPQVAMGIAMGAFRGVFVNFLWIRANSLQEDGKHFEAMELSRAITKLQPRFPRVWVFQAWNMAYNISVTTQTPKERWQWVQAGIRLLRDEGLRANPNDMLLHKELGWIYLHKVGGYTDDSNQYYKRQHAMEWEFVLGRPPQPNYANRESAVRIQQYLDWLTPIKDAPASMAQLRSVSPGAAAMADAYEQRLGKPIGFDLCRGAALFDAYERRGFDMVEASQQESAGTGSAFLRLWLDESFTPEDKASLLAFTRRQVLEDDYNMEPLRMYRLTDDLGPVDWRLPAAHGLYWAARGVDVGSMEVDERNSAAFDFVGAYRVYAQSLQEMFRSGELYYNFLDVVEGRYAYYQAVTNIDFADGYGNILDEVVGNTGIFNAERRSYRPYAAGYENFMEDVMAYHYRRGDLNQAEKWYERLRTWTGRNNNDPDRNLLLSLPLAEFVKLNLVDRMDSPSVAVQEVTSALEGAIFTGLLIGDDNAFHGMWSYARQAHAYYNEKQLRDVVAGGQNARTEYWDRDFQFVAGNIFAQLIMQVPPGEAELLYYNAGRIAEPWLQRYVYDPLGERYGAAIAAQFGPDAFETSFPEPDGMDQFRADLKRKQDERTNQAVEGLKVN